jgi:hypothetical protein
MSVVSVPDDVETGNDIKAKSGRSSVVPQGAHIFSRRPGCTNCLKSARLNV